MEFRLGVERVSLDTIPPTYQGDEDGVQRLTLESVDVPGGDGNHPPEEVAVGFALDLLTNPLDERLEVFLLTLTGSKAVTEGATDNVVESACNLLWGRNLTLHKL